MTQITTRELEKQINELQEYSNKYPSKDIQTSVEQVRNELENQTYNIAVVANMSAGKSTFINALFGEEILPSNNAATTDCATYIHSSKKDNAEKKAIIFFGDNSQKELSQDELSELKEYAKKDEDITEKKYKNVGKIELYYPFKHIPDEHQNDNFKIFFVDTPGPNNQGNSFGKHRAQTEGAIARAHAALFLFDYMQFDATKNSNESKAEEYLESYSNDLWSIIKNRKNSNPDFKVLFIVNKIDVIFEDAFKEKEPWSFIEKKKKNTEEELKEIAKEKGIKDAEVFFVGALPATISRMRNKLGKDNYSWLLENTLRTCKECFERIYPKENKKQAFEDFIGITAIEDKINTQINKQASEHLAQCIQSTIQTSLQREEKNLKTRIFNAQQPVNEANNNINNAKEEFKNIQSNRTELEKTIQDRQNKTLKRTIETAREDFDKAFNINTIINNAQISLSNNYSIMQTETNITITVNTEAEQKKIITTLEGSISQALEKSLDNFITPTIEHINKNCQDYKKYLRDTLQSFKNQVNERIGKAIQIGSIELNNSITQKDYDIITAIDIGDIMRSISSEVHEESNTIGNIAAAAGTLLGGVAPLIPGVGIPLKIGFSVATAAIGLLTKLFAGSEKQYKIHIQKNKLKEQIYPTIEKIWYELEKQVRVSSTSLLQYLQNLAIQETEKIIARQKDFISQLENDLKAPSSSLAEAIEAQKAFYALEATKKFLQTCEPTKAKEKVAESATTTQSMD